MKAFPIALAIFVSLSLTSLVEARQAKRHRSVKPPPVTDTWRAGGFSQQPAHMIEVKPGYWISSYGCVMDGGYGRLTPCDLTDHSD